MFARFDENPAMTLQDIKKTKRYGRTEARTDNVKSVYPPQTKFAGGIINCFTFYLLMTTCHQPISFANSFDLDQAQKMAGMILVTTV